MGVGVTGRIPEGNLERWFQIRENDAWVIKGMLDAGADTAMIAAVFAVDQAQIDAIKQGAAWPKVQYPGTLPYPD